MILIWFFDSDIDKQYAHVSKYLSKSGTDSDDCCPQHSLRSCSLVSKGEMGDSTMRFWIVILMATIAAQVTSGKRLYTALDMKNKFACVAENLKVSYH